MWVLNIQAPLTVHLFYKLTDTTSRLPFSPQFLRVKYANYTMDDDGSTKEKDSDDIMENINLGSLCLNPKSEGMKTRSTSNIKVS